MTFDLEWAKEPGLGGITGSYEANVLCEEEGGVISMSVASHNEGPGYYHANNSRWWWLLDVMDEADMIAEDDRPELGGIPLAKLEYNDGSHVLPEEIRTALEAYRSDDWQSVMDAYFEHEDDPEFWRKTWDEWVEWMTEAANHGGFRVW